MNTPQPVAALEHWYTLDKTSPALLGTQCAACKTYYFPKQTKFCKNPNCNSEVFHEVELSRFGKIWSYTNAAYQPPEPYVAAEPYVPFAIAAVELDKEKMIILGQVISGVSVDKLKVGMNVQLVLETLYTNADGVNKLIWKWQPV